MGFRLITFSFLASCYESDLEKSADAPSPYVRLDGVDYDSFSEALSDAVDDSTIEFCGTRDGPFARSGKLGRLTVVGCGREHAVLDGHHESSVLDVDTDQLYLSDLTLTRGLSYSTLYEAGEDLANDAYVWHPAAVAGVSETLTLDRCDVSLSLRAGGNLAIALAVTDGEIGSGIEVGGRIEGSESAMVNNFVEEEHPDESDPNMLPFRISVEAEAPRSVAELDHWSWGDEGTENGGADVAAPNGDGTYGAWNLHGTVSVYCDQDSGCSFEEQ